MVSVFTNQTPDYPNATDSASYELGMKFRSTQAGQITAIRYWKAPSETGTHIGKIWSANGQSLATVTFVNETVSGWQEQVLDAPLNIQANTTYVVSVNCNSHFPITYDVFANSISNGTLTSVTDGNNGIFGVPGSLPTNSYRNSNYFRDIVFTAVVSTPTMTKVSGDNQTATAGNALPNPLIVQVKDSSGNPQSGVTVNFAATNGGGSVSPTNAVTDANGQASTVLTLGYALGATSPVTNTVDATASGMGSVTFTATANPSQAINNQKVFTTQTPTISDVSDGVAYELGMKFQSAKGGQITAIRYWKATSETGTHVGKIWSANGQSLATVTFVNETVSGWQEQTLNSPLTIIPNTTYVVSVNINSHFVLTYNQLASSVVNGDLSSIAGGNGVYGNINTFPNNSYQNSNYFRDIVFVAGSSLVKVSGDNQTGTVGSTLPTPLVVQVKDGSGNPQPGVTVNFAVTSGGGSVSPTSVITDANGQANTILTLGSIPSGPNSATQVEATASGIGNAYFTAQAVPANANHIYLENQKPGTTNWKITSGSNNNEIAGYASATSVNKGGTLDFKISLAQPGTYTVDVYRLGYYQGKGGRLVFSTGSLNGITQPPLTLTDASTRLYEATNWSTSYTLQIGNDWTSGLYIAKLNDQLSGRQAYIFFVVRDDNTNSDILFQSSFNNMLAYNSMSGYSTYAWNSMNGQRAFKVSYDVPFIQASSGYWIANDTNSMLRYEYNMARWLESQGYNVTYVTNVDVHNNPQLLQRYKVFMSVGHDEYWTMEAYNNVKQSRDTSSGVNLTFFSANTCYWRVRFENSNTGQSNRVMACYKDDWQQDPIAPTNKFRSIQNNTPENSLLGVMYTGDRSNDAFGGYDFVISNSSHPYYAHTNVNDGDQLTLLVGYEWDAVVNNGSTPNGLVTLSESPVDPQNVDTDVPPGTNYQISNAVCYTAASGAKVFATGSIQWAWGLDSDGVQTPREDIRAKQIAVNILKDMGAIPTTPDAGIIVS
ncbi:MAG: DUF4082 domain-containing protein [Nostoc sp. TH1S01]|nr:DUF4082 domain-containing protein [Nostoc sp. TH1S01]